MIPTEVQSKIISLLGREGLEPGIQTRQVATTSLSEDDSIVWTLSTEQPVDVWDWERYEIISEVLLVDGMELRDGDKAVLLDSHIKIGVENVLGHVHSVEPTESGGYRGTSGALSFADDDKSQDAYKKVIGGHLFYGSVGYRVTEGFYVPEDMELEYNGVTYVGPVRVATKWVLREFSLIPIGADTLAKVKQILVNG